MPTWDVEPDLDDPQDESGVTNDGLGDHPDSGILQHGYEYGSLTRGLVSYYPFDGDVTDATPLGNDGTDNTSAGYVSGKVGSDAKDFDDSQSDNVVLPKLPPFNDGSSGWSVSVWAKFDSLEQGDSVTNDRLYSIQDGYQGPYVILGDGDQWSFRTYDGSTVYEVFSSTPTIGDWTHYVFVASSGTSDGELRLYENGTLVDGLSNWGIQASSALNTISSSGSSGHLDGSIDDFRIYDRALSTPEIEALYAVTQTQTVTPEDTL